MLILSSIDLFKLRLVFLLLLTQKILIYQKQVSIFLSLIIDGALLRLPASNINYDLEKVCHEECFRVSMFPGVLSIVRRCGQAWFWPPLALPFPEMYLRPLPYK